MKTESLFNLKQVKFGIKWWERLLLLFKKPNYGYDYGEKDKSIVVIVKELNGKIYIVDKYEVEDLKV